MARWSGAEEEPSDARSLAARWLRVIPSLREPAIRLGALTADLEAGPIDVVARALDDIASRAEQADPIAREVLVSAVAALGEVASNTRDALRELSNGGTYLALGRLLRRRGGLRDGHHAAPPPDERVVMTSGRPLTLGERKALARRSDRFALDRLLRDPHPAVIRMILNNPRITEEDVVRLAARRPTFGDIQTEIARSLRFGPRPRVRLALVQNPFTPPELAVPLLSLLIRPELESVIAGTELAPIVRSGAASLLERRPPMSPPDTSGTLQ